MRQSRFFKILSFTIVLTSFLLPVAAFAGDAATFEINIVVAPKVLNIQNEGEVVTVHTDIAYSLVIGASVELNGLPIAWWKSDSQGNFVAKFSMGAVKGLYESEVLGLGPNTLTLTGVIEGGAAFIGAEEIKVIDVVPKGK